jgi:hypothetical protein
MCSWIDEWLLNLQRKEVRKTIGRGTARWNPSNHWPCYHTRARPFRSSAKAWSRSGLPKRRINPWSCMVYRQQTRGEAQNERPRGTGTISYAGRSVLIFPKARSADRSLHRLPGVAGNAEACSARKARGCVGLLIADLSISPAESCCWKLPSAAVHIVHLSKLAWFTQAALRLWLWTGWIDVAIGSFSYPRRVLAAPLPHHTRALSAPFFSRHDLIWSSVDTIELFPVWIRSFPIRSTSLVLFKDVETSVDALALHRSNLLGSYLFWELNFTTDCTVSLWRATGCNHRAPVNLYLEKKMRVKTMGIKVQSIGLFICAIHARIVMGVRKE